MSASMLFDPGDAPSPEVEPGSVPSCGAAAPASLYRKYRPQSFDDAELVGQQHVVGTLRNAIRLDRVAHAYLFCGPRGTGKTTTARLLAKAVNCLHPDPDARPCNACANCVAINRGAATDVVEIDAASNRGIDDIRDLRERVKYAPAQLKTKFYIVDEAHQITGAAANAFLKTLEEPPAHTKFVLATTDPEELLQTIVSRCQRFDFRRIGVAASIARLQTVADHEGIAVAPEALDVIARHATGSLRDALGLLDQLAMSDRPLGDERGEASPRIEADDARAFLGLSRNERIETIVAAIADRDAATALSAVNTAVADGEDPRQLNRQLVSVLRQMLFARAGATADIGDEARALAERFTLDDLARLAQRFSEVDYRIRHAPYGHLPLEIALVEATVSGQTPATKEPARVPPATLERRLKPEPSPSTVANVDDGERPRPVASLRDRVRKSDPDLGARPAPTPVAARTAIEGAATTREAEKSSATNGAAEGSGATLRLEQLVDLWPRIRQDVKAVDRKVEALLSSADPARVNGSAVDLVTPYAFHRDRLNSDDVRGVVESVIARLVKAPVRVSCLLRDELQRGGAELQAPSNVAVGVAPPSARTKDGSPPPVEADLDAPDRVRAAMNIFDAEEIQVDDRSNPRR